MRMIQILNTRSHILHLPPVAKDRHYAGHAGASLNPGVNEIDPEYAMRLEENPTIGEWFRLGWLKGVEERSSYEERNEAAHGDLLSVPDTIVPDAPKPLGDLPPPPARDPSTGGHS